MMRSFLLLLVTGLTAAPRGSDYDADHGYVGVRPLSLQYLHACQTGFNSIEVPASPPTGSA
jgi:hypothetical protein